MISGNGTSAGARVYRRVETLVRAGVPAFLLAAPLRAYILTHSKMGKSRSVAIYMRRIAYSIFPHRNKVLQSFGYTFMHMYAHIISALIL